MKSGYLILENVINHKFKSFVIYYDDYIAEYNTYHYLSLSNELYNCNIQTIKQNVKNIYEQDSFLINFESKIDSYKIGTDKIIFFYGELDNNIYHRLDLVPGVYFYHTKEEADKKIKQLTIKEIIE
jgi:hypothetical protein